MHRRLKRHASQSYAMLNSPAAAGHCQIITLRPAGSDAIDVWGMYIPHVIQERKQVDQLLGDQMTSDRYTVIAGDMNAAYIPADASNGALTPSDQAHRKLLTDLHLEPIDIGTATDSRPHTFYSESHDSTHSKIDDLALSRNMYTDHTPVTQVLPATDGSDHVPFIVDIPLGDITFIPPGPELPLAHTTSTLRVPLTKQQEANFRTNSDLKVGSQAT